MWTFTKIKNKNIKDLNGVSKKDLIEKKLTKIVPI